MSKVISTDKLNKLAKALDNRIKLSNEELIELINDVRSMFGGRSIVYLSQLEYDSLDDETREDETKTYFITDAEDLSHRHENGEFLNSLNQATLDNINDDINAVEAMLGGKSIIYITQAEYDMLSVDNKTEESILYIITDKEEVQHEHTNKDFLDSLTEGNINAASVSGYSIWVGTTAELEAIEEKDPNTLYFEVSTGDEVVHVDVEDGVLNLTEDMYQKTNMVDGTEIVLPDVIGFTEIHLYFNATNDMNLVFPNCKYKTEPVIQAGRSYEIIAIYNTMEWLVDCVTYM
jgi:hypothetical protein